MSNKVILKRSSVSNRVPTSLDLSYGELALNYADGRIYFKTSDNTVDYFSAGAGTGEQNLTVYSYTGITVDTFTGTGTQTTFTLSTVGLSTNYSLVNIQGVFQPRSSYAISGSDLIFTDAPANGALVEITLFSANPNAPISYTDLINKPSIPEQYILPAATVSALGGVKIGSGISVDVSGTISGFSGSYLDLIDTPVIPDQYTLPTATATVLGGVKIGSGITITNGVISVVAGSYTLPTATATVLGGVKIGSGITISNGIISAFSGSYLDLTDTPSSSYVLPTATTGVLGGVKIGSGITITNGVISVAASSYTLPTATATVLGGVKIGSGITITSGVISAFSGNYTDLTNKPTIFSGSYTDLTNKPILPAVVVGTTETQTLSNKTLDNPTITNGYTEETTIANTNSDYTVDLANGSIQFLTLTANCVFTFPAPATGKSFMLVLKQDTTGSRTVQFPATVIWPGGTTPTITITANKRDKFIFTGDGTYWMGSNGGQNYI